MEVVPCLLFLVFVKNRIQSIYFFCAVCYNDIVGRCINRRLHIEYPRSAGEPLGSLF